MSSAMSFHFPPSAFRPATVELELRLGDGTPWRVSMSAGTERFIGAYPRLDGFRSDDALLTYLPVAVARD